MKRTDGVGMLLEGLFLGIAFILVHLVFEDKRAKEPWSWREMILFGVALGMALGGFWVETAI